GEKADPVNAPPTCVIIAAGRGSRLAEQAPSKPLLKVGGKALIDRAIDAAREAGVGRFVVVTGYAADTVERHLAARAAAEGIVIATVRNDEWEKENGLSVLKARELAGELFFLTMADHIVDPRLFAGLGGQAIGEDEIILAVDTRTEGHPYVDLEDVTRVLDKEGRIAAIGKSLAVYNAFDTGVFLCTPALFAALEASQRAGDFSLSGGIRALAANGKARTWKSGDLFWIDVDDERALEKAEAALTAGLVGRLPRAVGSRSWKTARILTSIAGVLLLAYLLLRIGTANVMVQLARFGPWFAAVIGLAFGWLFLQSWAWYLVQSSRFRPIPLMPLFRAKIISDSLNALLPSANLGGDAARAFLVRRYAPLTESIPGILVDKTIEFSMGILFLAAGFLLSLLFVELPRWMDVVAAVCLVGAALGMGLFVIFQMRGALWALRRLARIIPAIGRFADKKEENIRSLDRNLRLAYVRPNLKTVLAAVLHFLARALGAAEVFVIMRVLGTPVNFIQSFFITAGVSIINTAFFMVPGSLGVMESAQVFILRSLGFSATLGLSIGVIRRIRKLATIAVGLALFALGRHDRRPIKRA
ncbi:MAG TPA: lysylphosphatidylglycerol synthase domain-containing protein, partial [Acidobacteriota bacterium]|nr:lysylphosphatidylglycerol synthase domain-containing protein [Acidobacteriota bacterium]